MLPDMISDRASQCQSTPQERYNYKFAHSQAILEALKVEKAWN